VLQAAKLLEQDDLHGLGHNSAEYLHRITEAIKLVFADREAWFGDPRFVDVPIDALLSDSYAQRRRSEIREKQAWPGLPAAGTAEELQGAAPRPTRTPAAAAAWSAPDLDTSYVCVVDGKGNTFSATPSDGSYNAPVIPGLGIIPSPRGSQSWGDPGHPSAAAAGKRPRLTPNPAIAVGPDMVMPFGTPGGDVQTQAMLQVLMNIVVFGMDPQDAVEAPRSASYSFPSSFEPHEYHPGRLNLEGRIRRAVGDELAGFGHGVQWWPDWTWLAGGVCTIVADRKSGLLAGAADPRRPAYAIGW
jgi:gamma-glutamyltranspeptidase/glutathione hydrolase